MREVDRINQLGSALNGMGCWRPTRLDLIKACNLSTGAQR